MVEEGEEDFETGNSQYFRLGILKKKEGRKEERKSFGDNSLNYFLNFPYCSHFNFIL
jgi:hypothetical protein